MHLGIPYYATSAEEFEAFTPMFPIMLNDEEHGAEWDRLTTIAEQTDDPDIWNSVMDMEAATDHQVFEGNW